jgi:hypothetical protein
MRRMLMAVPLLLVLAGCGGAKDDGLGVATVSGTQPGPSASASVALDEEERKQQFTNCMRENGVDMDDFEAGAGARVAIRADDKKTNEAMQKCRQYLPNGGEPPKLSPEDIEKMRQFAQCMRENGVPDFPDPDPETGMLKAFAAGESNKSQIENANEKCKDKMPQMRQKATK